MQKKKTFKEKMKNLDRGLKKLKKIKIKMFDNQREIYKLLVNSPIPRTKKEIEAFEIAIELYEKNNEEFNKTIESKKEVIRICKEHI